MQDQPIATLPPEILSRVFEALDLISLTRAGATCKAWRAAAGPCSEPWRQQCARRWHGPLNTALFREAGHLPRTGTGGLSVNWRSLFFRDNGWARPRLGVWHLGSGALSAAAVSEGDDRQPVLGYAAGSKLCILDPAAGSGGTRGGQAAGAQQGAHGAGCWRGTLPGGGAGQQPPVPTTSLAVLDPSRGLVAAGSWMGHIWVCRLQRGGDAGAPAPQAAVEASWHGCRCGRLGGRRGACCAAPFGGKQLDCDLMHRPLEAARAPNLARAHAGSNVRCTPPSLALPQGARGRAAPPAGLAPPAGTARGHRAAASRWWGAAPSGQGWPAAAGGPAGTWAGLCSLLGGALSERGQPNLGRLCTCAGGLEGLHGMPIDLPKRPWLVPGSAPNMTRWWLELAPSTLAAAGPRPPHRAERAERVPGARAV